MSSRTEDTTRRRTGRAAETVEPDGVTFPDNGDDETVKLAGYRRALETGDEPAIRDLAAQLLFRPSVIALHRVLIAEHAELAEAAEGAGRLAEEVASLEREIPRLQAIRATSIKESEEIADRIQKACERLAKARYELSVANVAGIKRDTLAGWAGPLFGFSEAKYGVPLHADTTTLAACQKLGITPSSPGAWRGPDFGRSEPRPRRRLVSTAAAVNKPKEFGR